MPKKNIVRTNNATYMALERVMLNDCPQYRYRGNPRISYPHALNASMAWRLLCNILILAMFTPAVVAQPALKTLHQVLGAQLPDFNIHHSEHFVLATDADGITAKSTLFELEDTYQHVRRWADSLQLFTKDVHEAWPVVYFMHQKDYELSCQRMGVASNQQTGLYLPSQHVMIAQDVANLEQWHAVNKRILQLQLDIRALSNDWALGNGVQLQQKRDQLRVIQNGKKDIRQLYQQLVIRHEAAHMILNGLGILNPKVSNPDWLMEGLACQFEIPIQKNKTLGFNPHRLEDLKIAPAMVAFSMFVNEDTFSVRTTGDKSIAYSQAWALVYYLQTKRPKQFTTYLACQSAPAALPNNNLESDCFHSTFLTGQSTFESKWQTWLSSLKLDHLEGRR